MIMISICHHYVRVLQLRTPQRSKPRLPAPLLAAGVRHADGVSMYVCTTRCSMYN
jgi:hypothetical protein